MADAATTGRTFKQTVGHHLRVAVAGLCVVVVPAVAIYAIIEKLQGILEKAIPAIRPVIQDLGGPTVALLMVLAVLVASWLLGLLVTHTELGQRFLAWEKAVFAKRSKVIQKQVEHAERVADEEAKARVNARPALANVQGGWQPGMIMETPAGGRIGVFIPELPSTSTGRLLCLDDADVMPIDMPVDEFEKALEAHGHGAGRWVQLLAEREA